MSFRALIPFFVALGAVALMFWSFVAGINAALDAGGTGSLFWQLVFIAAALAVVGSIVLSIINLVKKRAMVISIATLVVAVLPLIAVLVLVVNASQVGTR